MPEWEYLVEMMPSIHDERTGELVTVLQDDRLDMLGGQGWELASVFNDKLIFKRRKTVVVTTTWMDKV